MRLLFLLLLPTFASAEVVLTQPHCDVCTAEDKAWLRSRSPVISRLVALIDGAKTRVDAAQFTFSVAEIEQALLRAHQRGVSVRLAMDKGQEKQETAGPRLLAAGVAVRFVAGNVRPNAPPGLQHAKYLLADGVLAAGSGNWSSTGTTINDEGWIIEEDAGLIAAFSCHFEALWKADANAAGLCGQPGRVQFSPGTAPVGLLTDGLRGAQRSVDVLMHHLLFDKLIKELAKAAARGVRVRIVVNAGDRAETQGPLWDRLRAAGVQIRYKQGNGAQYQLMHHKLALVDDTVLLHGSGNWSGSAFFSNFEFFVRHDAPAIVQPFSARFAQLWAQSLSAESLDAERDAARQRAAETRIFFGNLHAHFPAGAEGRSWDDGKPERRQPDGTVEAVLMPPEVAGAARFAFEYARDRGRLDFLALTPHTVDDAPGDGPDVPDMEPAGYADLREAAAAVNRDSAGRFLALAGMEWNTNSRGNHVNIFNSSALAKVPRGRFDQLYQSFLAERAQAGEAVWIMFNHPRTFRRHAESFEGAWDQAFDGLLTQVPKGGERAQKFNDYGLDDYPPLSAVLPDWISGAHKPDPAVVAQSFRALEEAARPYARLMEVTVGRGTELASEVPQNPSLAPAGLEEGEVPPENAAPDAKMERISKVRPDWEHYLLGGFRLAPAANHDNHFANWGSGHTSRTAVLAESLDPAAFHAAVAARRVYASEDENLRLHFHAGGRVTQGGELAVLGEGIAGEVQVEDPDFAGPFTVRVYRGQIGGERVEPISQLEAVGGAWLPLSLPLPGPGRWFFYLEVHEPGPDRMAWSAPIWIERLAP